MSSIKLYDAGGTHADGVQLGATGEKIGFCGTAPAAQQALVAALTVTATTGTLPTADGAVTIADAATPTVAELQEFCVELNAKLNAINAILKTLGLEASA